VTQQNAAMVEQSTAASHSLAGEASELARLVGQFQTGAVAASRQHAVPRAVAKPAFAKPRAGGSSAMGKFTPKLITASKNAVPAVAGGDNWDEF